MVHGAGMGIGRKAASAASHSMSAYAHGKVHEAEQDNSAAEGAHRAEVWLLPPPLLFSHPSLPPGRIF